MRLSRGLPAAACLLLAACAAGPSPAPATPSGSSSPSLSSAPLAPTAGARPTAAPAPSGYLAVPTAFGVELTPGLYWSAPPFDLGFPFEVDQTGWVAGHLNGEFFDLQRHEGTPGGSLPLNMVGFGLPLTIQGATDIPVEELTPAAAVAVLEARTNVETTNVTELELFGRQAVRVDLHAPNDSTPVLAGDNGTFAMSADKDVRLAFIPLDGALLIALVQSAPDNLEAAWAEALPILESAVLP